MSQLATSSSATNAAAQIAATKLNKLRQIWSSIINEKAKKILVLAIGFSVASLGGVLLYQKFLYPRLHPIQSAWQRLKNVIQKAQRAQKSILQLEIIKHIKIAQNGISFNFSVLKGLDKKPIGASRGNTSDPFLPPFEKGLFVETLSPTHSLIFNKFAVVKNHMLVITTQFSSQGTLLTPEDFSASQKVLVALDGFWYFNSGAEAGASQPHRHVQVMPREARQETPILNVLAKRVEKLRLIGSNVEDIAYVPFDFRHIIKILKTMVDGQSIEEYGEYLTECYRDCLKKLDNYDESSGQIKNRYNMIVFDGLMMVILRKQERTNSAPRIALNAMGFTGSFLLKADQEISKHSVIEPFSLLQEVCFANSESQITLKGTPIEGFTDIVQVEPIPKEAEIEFDGGLFGDI